MPVAALFLVLATAVVACLRVTHDPDPTLLDVAPFLGAILAVPLAAVKDLFQVDRVDPTDPQAEA